MANLFRVFIVGGFIVIAFTYSSTIEVTVAQETDSSKTYSSFLDLPQILAIKEVVKLNDVATLVPEMVQKKNRKVFGQKSSFIGSDFVYEKTFPLPRSDVALA